MSHDHRLGVSANEVRRCKFAALLPELREHGTAVHILEANTFMCDASVVQVRSGQAHIPIVDMMTGEMGIVELSVSLTHRQ